MAKPTDAEVVGQVSSWYEESRLWRLPMDNKVDRIYEKYRNYLTIDDTYQWQSKIFIPEFFTVVWTALPAFLESMLGQQPYINIEPLRPDTVEGSKYAEKILDLQFERIGDDQQGIFMSCLKTWLDNIIYGNGFKDVGWKYETGRRRRRVPRYNDEVFMLPDPESGTYVPVPPGQFFLGYEDVEEDAVLYDDPHIKTLDWKQVFPDPYAVTVQPPARFIITRDILTKQDIESFVDDREGFRPKNLKNIKYTNSPFLNEDQSDSRRDIDEIGQIIGTDKGEYTELLKCQYAWKNGGRWEEYISLVADGSTLIYHDRNPYHHNRRTIIKSDCFPLNNRFYSIGLLEPIEDVGDGINQRYNQANDIITMIINPMYKMSESLYNKLYDLYEGNIPAIPGRMIPISGNEDISAITQFPQLRPAQEDIRYLEGKVQSASGAYEHMRGALPERQEKATTVLKADEKANLRFKILMKILWYTDMRPTADMFIQLNHQFRDEPETVKMLNQEGEEEFRRIYMEDIPYDGMAYRPNMMFIDPGVSKQFKSKLLQEWAVAMSNTPMVNYIDWRRFGQMALDLNEFPEGHQLILSEKEGQQKQLQQFFAENPPELLNAPE
jgi:hypothetical protein